jgi:hypothetical protein
VLPAIFVVIVLGFGACAAFVGSVANEVSKDQQVPVQQPNGQTQQAQPPVGGAPAAETGQTFRQAGR